MPRRFPTYVLYCEPEIAFVRRKVRGRRGAAPVVAEYQPPEWGYFRPGARLELRADGSEDTADRVRAWLEEQVIDRDQLFGGDEVEV